ncbi:DUF2092 domain-containing protein [Sandaracinobacteroides hominis]|uniref:DUF2092 domain-containing protein n=1 Tax=Sandaracinobacteroides hominis TaxID=2780086 RepID=UPI0018F57D67|nr:DUF2092 domain-containing protein [Sandaracinobacteroides hominis]
MTIPKSAALAQVATAALLLLALPAAAQTAPAAPAAPAAAPADVLDPDAADALNRMGAALRALNTFEVRSDATVETVYEGNHKLQSLSRTTYTVQRPDKMVVDIKGDTTHRRFYYDGKTMTVVGMKIGKYVKFPVSGTIAEVLGRAYDEFGIDFPLQDLFRWGDPSSTVVPPVAGFRVGDAMIGDTKLSQYFFRQPGVDFQVWLEDGTQALPRKMVITNTDEPAQPQYVAYFTWNQAPTISADTFTFTPRAGDQLVDFGTAKQTVK